MADNFFNNNDTHTKTFVKSSVKYDDLNSSGITLIGTAIIGYIFIILDTLEMLPIRFMGANVVMIAMFTAFLIAGILSIKKALTVKSKISEEEETESDIINYFTENFSSEMVDNVINAQLMSDGDLYYERFDYIKTTICNKFSDIDDSFAEHIADEIYQKLFE